MGIERRKFLTHLAAALGLGAAALGGYAISTRLHPMAPVLPPPAPATQAGYTCPMHPQILQEHEGSCPICGMTLVKTSNGELLHHSDMVHVDADAQQRIGLQLATVSMGTLTRTVRAFATLTQDESKTVSVNSKVEGWLRKVTLQGIGQPVRRGQVLYEIYSPELQQRQREYIDLLTRKDGLLGDNMAIVSSNAAMVGSLSKEKFRARARLIAADMSEDLINTLEQSRRVLDVVAVRAEHDGLVTGLSMHEGNYVNPMQQILTYTGNDSVWAEVSLFPDQLSWIKNGDRIVFHSTLDNTATQTATVLLNTLQIDPATRGAKLRMALNNRNGAFRPGAFADVEIEAGKQRSLHIPRDALIRTGHGDFVVVAEAGNHFRRAKVVPGIETNDAVAIVSGLKEGDRVAANGQFLLDGAASMQALQARLDARP